MNIVERFFRWYEDNYTLNAGIAAGLFLLQIVHLIWLFGEVVWAQATGTSLFQFTDIWQSAIIIADYTEIPALIATSLVYINEIRKNSTFKPWLYLFFLNSQWLHIFWITDEFVIQSFRHTELFPIWLAWIAITIDYLELPVIIETIRRFIRALKENRAEEFLTKELN